MARFAVLAGLAAAVAVTGITLPIGADALSTTMTMRSVTISGLRFDYCGNGSLTTPDPAVRTVVVVVHGTSRNACDYARYANESAQLAGVAASTLIVAPYFTTTSSSSRLYWSSSGWKQGDDSRNTAAKVSSFAVLDDLLARANRTTLPNLTRVVLAGHSAGAQALARYAAGQQAPAVSGVERRFVVANPSSWLYLDNRRWVGGQWAAPVTTCDYDEYKYGLVDRNAYMASSSVLDLRARYAAARVTYLLGELDTFDEGDLDTSCAANWQGAHRLERGKRYYAHVTMLLGSALGDRHRLVTVPGVGHSAHDMLTSAQGQTAMFGP